MPHEFGFNLGPGITGPGGFGPLPPSGPGGFPSIGPLGTLPIPSPGGGYTVAGIPNIAGDAITLILDQGHLWTWDRIAEIIGQGLEGRHIQAIWDALTGGSRNPTAEDACIWPTQADPATGECRMFVGTQPGPDGQPVNGRYGTGMVPTTRNITRHVCPKGMVLGDDGICYNRRNIANSDREWPKGTKPLGTAEEMRAVRIASRFAKRYERTTKRMQKIGLVKKPVSRRRAPAAKRIGPGITVVDTD